MGRNVPRKESWERRSSGIWSFDDRGSPHRVGIAAGAEQLLDAKPEPDRIANSNCGRSVMGARSEETPRMVPRR